MHLNLRHAAQYREASYGCKKNVYGVLEQVAGPQRGRRNQQAANLMVHWALGAHRDMNRGSKLYR
jgi:hypothetical protein